MNYRECCPGFLVNKADVGPVLLLISRNRAIGGLLLVISKNSDGEYNDLVIWSCYGKVP